MDYGSIMAGQSAGLVKKEQTCKEIIEEIFLEAKEIIVEKSKLI
jgi:enoyl-[acyl-carrier protein] reductase II